MQFFAEIRANCCYLRLTNGSFEREVARVANAPVWHRLKALVGLRAPIAMCQPRDLGH